MADGQPIPPTTQTDSRRRSSGFMPAFESLHQQKRTGDANAARRQSMSEQQVGAGMFSTLFHNIAGRNHSK